MGAVATSGCEIVSGDVTFPASVKAQWTTVHGNLSDTAESAAALLRPTTYASAFVYPMRIHAAATRISIMARYKQATSAVTTSPVVRLYGIWGADSVVTPAGVIASDGTAIIRRLDNGSSNSAGITLTLTTAVAADKMRDDTYRYSDEYDITGVDLRGAKWLLALTETAANISGGADTVVELLAMATN